MSYYIFFIIYRFGNTHSFEHCNLIFLSLFVFTYSIITATTIAQRMAKDWIVLRYLQFLYSCRSIDVNGGIAYRLIRFATLVGSLPGGLALINIISAMLMGAIAGSAMAPASAMEVYQSLK